ncbi:MAG: hypothetical protein ABIP08_04980, partial [Lautropia sp.]
MHRKPFYRHLLALVLTAGFALAALPAGSQPAGADVEPYLQVETGSHAAVVRRIDVAVDRSLVVTVSDDKTARVWDLATGELRQVLRPAVGAGEIGRLYGVAIHPTEDLVAVGGTTGRGVGSHRILMYSMSSGLPVRSFDARGGNIKKLAWSRDGSLLLAVYAGDHALRAFDRTGALVHEQPLTAPSYGLAVSADGMAAASSLDGRIVLVTARDGRVAPVRTFTVPTSQAVGLAFSPDGSRLAVASFSPRDAGGRRKAKTAPQVLDVASGRTLLQLPEHEVSDGSLMSVAWSTDGRQIVVGGSGYNARRRFPIFFHDAA